MLALVIVLSLSYLYETKGGKSKSCVSIVKRVMTVVKHAYLLLCVSIYCANLLKVHIHVYGNLLIVLVRCSVVLQVASITCNMRILLDQPLVLGLNLPPLLHLMYSW